MQKMGGKGMMRNMGALFGGGGLEEMQEMAKNMEGAGLDGPLGKNPFAPGGDLAGATNPLLNTNGKKK